MPERDSQTGYCMAMMVLFLLTVTMIVTIVLCLANIQQTQFSNKMCMPYKVLLLRHRTVTVTIKQYGFYMHFRIKINKMFTILFEEILSHIHNFGIETLK